MVKTDTIGHYEFRPGWPMALWLTDESDSEYMIKEMINFIDWRNY